MTRVTRRVALLSFSIGALLVACGGRQTPGYGGPPIANAIRAVVRPASAHSGPLLFTGDGSNRPFVYTQVLVKNTSPYAVRIHGCTATALDGDGHALFRFSVVGPTRSFDPGTAWEA